jgi:hypothetical protein
MSKSDFNWEIFSKRLSIFSRIADENSCIARNANTISFNRQIGSLRIQGTSFINEKQELLYLGKKVDSMGLCFIGNPCPSEHNHLPCYKCRKLHFKGVYMNEIPSCSSSSSSLSPEFIIIGLCYFNKKPVDHKSSLKYTEFGYLLNCFGHFYAVDLCRVEELQLIDQFREFYKTIKMNSRKY